MHAGGFREKWKADMFNPKVYYTRDRTVLINTKKNIQIFMEDPKEDLKPINLDQLYFAFGLLAIGIIFAYFAFMIEITAGWISNKMLK